jgi:hypothetical protein
MSFQDIELEWKGDIYTIKAHRVMGAIARIEEYITLPELNTYTQRGGAPIGRLSQAYCAVLKYAGASVTEADVYEQSFATNGDENNIMLAVTNIMMILLPPSVRKRLDAGEDEVKNQDATVVPKAALSKRPIKRQSRKANG